MTIKSDHLGGQVSYADLSSILKRQILAKMRSANENENVAFSMVRPKEGLVPPLYPPEATGAQAEEASSLKAGRRSWQKFGEGL